MAYLIQGAHVTINARSEMDLEEDTITDKVAKASGTVIPGFPSPFFL
jgi:hypothetical protein